MGKTWTMLRKRGKNQKLQQKKKQKKKKKTKTKKKQKKKKKKKKQKQRKKKKKKKQKNNRGSGYSKSVLTRGTKSSFSFERCRRAWGESAHREAAPRMQREGKGEIHRK